MTTLYHLFFWILIYPYNLTSISQIWVKLMRFGSVMLAIYFQTHPSEIISVISRNAPEIHEANMTDSCELDSTILLNTLVNVIDCFAFGCKTVNGPRDKKNE